VKRCTKGKSCGAACISANKRCIIELGPRISAQIGKVVQKLGGLAPRISEGEPSAIRKAREKAEAFAKREEQRKAEREKQNKIKGTIEKVSGTAPKFERQPGGGYRAKDANGNVLGYINKGGIGFRVYDGEGNAINNYRKLEEAKAALAKKTTRGAKELEKLANEPKEVQAMAKAYQNGKILGSGAMGEVRRNSGPPPSIIKKGEIGENEAAALKKLEGTGVAPKLLGNTALKNAQEIEFGLGGHVNAGQGMLQMSEAKGLPVAQVMYDKASPKERVERLDSLLEARAKMHMAGVAHNDMHPGNVFYDSKTRKSEIVDFGLSQVGYRFALAEALGTNKGGDYQSEDHFTSGATKGSSKYKKFDDNRERILMKLNVPYQEEPGIRNRLEDHPEWLQKLSEPQAKKLLGELYEGV